MRNGQVLAVLALLACAGPAFSAAADDRPSINLPTWVTFPSDAVTPTDFYPESAAVSGLSGSVMLRCELAPGGSLERCIAFNEAPKVGFARSALVMSELMTVSAVPATAMPDPKHVDIPFIFHWPVGMTLPQSAVDPRMVTNPDWKKLPASDDLSKFVPATAMQKGEGGKVKLLCFVTVQGLMDRCKVLSEYPTGIGLGAAALRVTQFFTMTPRMLDGVPTGNAEVVIPIAFDIPHNAGGGGGQTINVLSSVIWTETPTAAQVAAAFPKNLVGKVDQGHVIMRCRFKRDATLRECEAVVELPSSKGFGSAALKLANYFKADIEVYKSLDLLSFSVDVPINFSGAMAPAATQITAPVWTRVLDSSTVQDLYPAQAAAARVATGKAVVSCTVTHSGALTNCQSVREEPPNLGFGEAAVHVAEVLALNPWTTQGNPVDGDNIRLPVVFKQAAASPETTSAPPPAPAAKN